jgi:hypothetical protein
MAQVACPRRPNTWKVMLEDESDPGYATLTMAMSCWEPGMRMGESGLGIQDTDRQ